MNYYVGCVSFFNFCSRQTKYNKRTHTRRIRIICSRVCIYYTSYFFFVYVKRSLKIRRGQKRKVFPSLRSETIFVRKSVIVVAARPFSGTAAGEQQSTRSRTREYFSLREFLHMIYGGEKLSFPFISHSVSKLFHENTRRSFCRCPRRTTCPV